MALAALFLLTCSVVAQAVAVDLSCLSPEEQAEIKAKVTVLAEAFDTSQFQAQMLQAARQSILLQDKLSACINRRTILLEIVGDNCAAESNSVNDNQAYMNTLSNTISTFSQTTMSQLQLIRAAYKPCN
jgi:hypothetical protein